MSGSGFFGSGIGPREFGGRRRVPSWQVVTAGAATHTIGAFTVSASTVVDWGDGSTSTYTGSGARTHNYAGAGTWTVRVLSPLNVTALELGDNKVVFNSVGVAQMTNITQFALTAAHSGTFNSSDVSAWRPTTFVLNSLPAGFTGTFNSSDVSAWRPTLFSLFDMPTGYAGTFNSSDVSAWRPTLFRLYNLKTGYAGTFNTSDVSAWRPTVFNLRSMPTGYAGTFSTAVYAAWTTLTESQIFSLPATMTVAVDSDGLKNLRALTYFDMTGNALSQANVDAILYQLYQASATPRTASGGTIRLGGTNAAPSGTFQAVASPPVSGSTPGKEVAYELLNDSLGLFNNWATVTITA